jgi:hypothetical protein
LSTNSNLPVIPVSYTEDVGKRLVKLVQQGKAMQYIADSLDVDISQMYDWIKNPACVIGGDSLASIYVRARDIDADRLADEIARLALKAEEMGERRDSRPDGLRVAMQGLQWLASVRAPRRYNPKYVDEMINNDHPAFTVNIQVNGSDVKTVTGKGDKDQ